MLIKKDIIELGWRGGLQVDLGCGLMEGNAAAVWASAKSPETCSSCSSLMISGVILSLILGPDLLGFYRLL
jgi:hypothetical protein